MDGLALGVRYGILRDTLAGNDLVVPQISLTRKRSTHPRVRIISSLHSLSVLLLTTCLHTDSILALWVLRVAEHVVERLAFCSPPTIIDGVRKELKTLVSLLGLSSLLSELEVSVKRAPSSNASDFLENCMERF